MNGCVYVFMLVNMADFSYITDKHSRTMLKNAYAASESLRLSDWFRTWEPEPNLGYMFSSHLNIGLLSAALESDGHSGASFGWVCRALQSYYRDPAGFEKAWLVSKSKKDNDSKPDDRDIADDNDNTYDVSKKDC
jgi:hypothetical protein